MNDRMSDMDSLVEDAAAIHQIHGEVCICGFGSAKARDRSEHIARAALLAVGLPALLERVEAATVARTEFVAMVAEHDALAAKVAAAKALLIGAVLVDADALRTALDASETP